MKRFGILVVLGCLVLFTSVAFAEDRQVTLGPGTAGEPTLQAVLNCIYAGASCSNIPTLPTSPGVANTAPNAALNQLAGQIFEADFTGHNSDVSYISVQFRFSGLDSRESFGIYSAGSTDPSKKIQVLPAGSDFNTNATVTWTADGRIVVQTCNTQTYVCTVQAYSAAQLGISPLGFGVYLGINDGTNYYPSGMTYYSEDTLNPGGYAQVLSYKPEGSDTLTWAFEDLSRTPNGVNGFVSDGDFQDMIVTAESVHAVPEPASMLLFGTGLTGIASLLRRRMKK